MGNPYKRLLDTVNNETTQVGTVQTVNGDGTSDVLLVGGGVVRATGDSFLAGQPVFLKGGQVLSAAPSLNIQLIEV